MNNPIACLGRPIELGCLYDARTEDFLTGTRLWSLKSTKRMTTTRSIENKSTDLQFNCTFAEKCYQFGVSASTLLNAMCGKIPVSGSSGYLVSSRSSLNSVSVTLTYTILKEFKEFHLSSSPDYLKALPSGTASAVVTGVKYGAKAILVLERDKREGETDAQVADMLYNAALALKCQFDQEKPPQYDLSIYSGIRCSYYGDFVLEPPPLTLCDAFGCASRLNSQNANAPLEVHLTPLSHLGGQQVTPHVVVSSEHLNACGDYCHLLHDVIGAARITASNLIKSPWQTKRQMLLQFAELVQVCKTRFSDELRALMDRDYGNRQEKCQAFRDLLARFKDKSPFSSELLHKWLASQEQECAVLQAADQVLTSAGARVLKDAAEIDRFAFSSERRLLLEVQLPAQTSFLGVLKHFLDTRENSVEEATRDTTWLGTVDQQIFTQSTFEASKFLQENPKLPTGLTSVQRGEIRHLELNTKVRKDQMWISTSLPAPPRDLNLVEVDKNTATISCKLPMLASSNSYTIKLTIRGPNSTLPCETMDGHMFSVKDLSSDTEYTARAVGVTELGHSVPVEMKFRTKGMCCIL